MKYMLLVVLLAFSVVYFKADIQKKIDHLGLDVEIYHPITPKINIRDSIDTIKRVAERSITQKNNSIFNELAKIHDISSSNFRRLPFEINKRVKAITTSSKGSLNDSQLIYDQYIKMINENLQHLKALGMGQEYLNEQERSEIKLKAINSLKADCDQVIKQADSFIKIQEKLATFYKNVTLPENEAAQALKDKLLEELSGFPNLKAEAPIKPSLEQQLNQDTEVTRDQLQEKLGL